MILSVIAAKTERGVIGRDNKLPWHLPADLKRFKALTTGHTIVMGRKTFESIGRPLPNRRSIIISHNREYRQEGAEVVRSLDEALAAAAEDAEVFVIGGAQVFHDAISRADRLYLTVVHGDIDGDVFFPEYDSSEWSLEDREVHQADERHAHAFTFENHRRLTFP